MIVTRLKLPPELRERVARVIEGSDKTSHAFMVDAIARETERAELRRRFVDEARAAEQAIAEGGHVYDLHATFDYLEAHAAGKPARRPRGRPLHLTQSPPATPATSPTSAANPAGSPKSSSCGSTRRG
jgi:predicted transcriptional regulator